LRYKKRGFNKSGGHFQFLTHAHIVDRFFITENFLFCNQPEKKNNRKAMFHKTTGKLSFIKQQESYAS